MGGKNSLPLATAPPWPLALPFKRYENLTVSLSPWQMLVASNTVLKELALSAAVDFALPHAQDLLTCYWNAVHFRDVDQLASQFSDDGTLWFGNGTPVTGRHAIRNAFTQLFNGVVAVRRRAVTSWIRDGIVVDESDVTFTFDDGSTTTVPITTILWTRVRRIHVCRLLLYPEPALLRRSLSLIR